MSSRSTTLHGTHWKAGISRRCITPQEPVWLAGYTTEKRFAFSTKVLNDLHVKALALEDPGGRPAVILTVDICFFRKPLAQAVIGNVMARTGLERDQILLNLSHTHSAPVVAQPLDDRWPLDDEARHRALVYTEHLVRAIGEVALEALSRLAPARLSWGRGQAGDFLVNRRKIDEQGRYAGMGPNPDGPTDRKVPVLRVEDAGGGEKAVVFGCACHNVTMGSSLAISSDYAGFAAEAIEASHPGVCALFLTGCAADANTEPRGGDQAEKWTRQHGETLAAEVERVLAGDLAPVRGGLRTACATARLPLQPVPDKEVISEEKLKGSWSSTYNHRRLKEALEAGLTPPEIYEIPMSLWRFGESLDLLGLPGEIGAEHAKLAAERLGTPRFWVAGYCHEVFGYLPSKRMLREGGYETLGLLQPGLGFFAPEAEDALLDAVEKLARAAGG